jgi:hypothetical protein
VIVWVGRGRSSYLCSRRSTSLGSIPLAYWVVVSIPPHGLVIPSAFALSLLLRGSKSWRLLLARERIFFIIFSREWQSAVCVLTQVSDSHRCISPFR